MNPSHDQLQDLRNSLVRQRNSARHRCTATAFGIAVAIAIGIAAGIVLGLYATPEIAGLVS